MTLNAANYLRTDRGTEIGTQILGDGNVTVAAKNDVNIRQGVINSEHGATTIAAGNNVNIENGNTYSRDQYGLQYKEKGLLSRTVNTIRKDYEHTGVTASTIGGNTIQVGANHDVNVTGSNVLGTGDVAISAGNKVRTNSAEDSGRNDIYQHSKKKGLMGAGLGFTIGSKQIKDTEAESYTTNVNTLIGSVDGTIAINANNDAHITSTDIVGKHGITVSAADITLDGNHDVAMSKQVHEEKRSGLTVSLGGSIASALNTAHGLQSKASSRNDKRLATLENIEAGKELKKGYEQIKEYQEFTPKFVKQRAEKLIDSSKIKKGYVAQIDEELKNPNLSDKEIRRLEKDRNRLQQEANQEYAEGTSDLQDINSEDQKQYNAKKRAKKDGLANIHVSIGSSKSRSETILNRRNYAGGKLVSDEGIALVAKPNMQDKGNIVAVGETIRGKSVRLEANNDISLLAATNTSEKQVAYDSKGWSIGANLSVNGGGLLGLDANYNQGMERGNTFKTTHIGTVIQANQVNLHSGKDTTIAGSKVYGDSVTAEIGGNLAIKSLQDTETYRGKSKNAGFSVSTNGLQLGSVSAEYTNGTIKSDYASVTDQAGIYAGTGGFAIQTKGNTTLEGAIIGSKSTADKNSLVTDSLTIKDIKNKAEYTSRNTGLSYTSVSGFKNLSQAGKDAVYNSLGLLPKLLPDSSKSSESTTKSAIANGTIKTQSSNIDIDKISRDTESSLNKLDTIFDKKKVEERQELARLFAKDAFEQLHYWKPKTKEEKVAKALAHAVVAESSARIAGNPAGSGFYAGLSNEALIGEIQKISKSNPAVAQWLSASLGAVVNGALDKPVVTGATEAQYGTKWNGYLNVTDSIIEGAKDFANYVATNHLQGRKARGHGIVAGNRDFFRYTNKGKSAVKNGQFDVGRDIEIINETSLKNGKNIVEYRPPIVDSDNRISEWNVNRQSYDLTNKYVINGVIAIDNGGIDKLGRVYMTREDNGKLIYSGTYQGPDGSRNWKPVISNSEYISIKNPNTNEVSTLSITHGDLDMAASGASSVYNPETHRIVNARTNLPLSEKGAEIFKNNFNMDSLPAGVMYKDLQYEPDHITVLVKPSENYVNMDANTREAIYTHSYNNPSGITSDYLVNGYKTGAIEPAHVEPPKVHFSIGKDAVKVKHRYNAIRRKPQSKSATLPSIDAQISVKADLGTVHLKELSGKPFWRDTTLHVGAVDANAKLKLDKEGIDAGGKISANIVNFKVPIMNQSYDQLSLKGQASLGYGASAGGHIKANWTDLSKGVTTDITPPQLGVNASISTELGDDSNSVEIKKDFNKTKKRENK